MLCFGWAAVLILLPGAPERWARTELAAFCALIAFAARARSLSLGRLVGAVES